MATLCMKNIEQTQKIQEGKQRQFTIDMLKTEYNKEQTIIYLTLNPQHNTACAASQVIKFIEVQKRCNPSTWKYTKDLPKENYKINYLRFLRSKNPNKLDIEKD